MPWHVTAAVLDVTKASCHKVQETQVWFPLLASNGGDTAWQSLLGQRFLLSREYYLDFYIIHEYLYILVCFEL